MNKIFYFAVFHWAENFWKQTFWTPKFKNSLLLCLSEKEWNVDSLDEIVKVSDLELLFRVWPELSSSNFW